MKGLEHNGEQLRELRWFNLEKKLRGHLITLNNCLKGGGGEVGVSLCSPGRFCKAVTQVSSQQWEEIFSSDIT